jgi:hypothetical protein
MGQKATAISGVFDRKFVREPGHARRSVRTTDSAKNHGDQFLDKGRSARPNVPEVIDDLPECAAVLNRELDAIEAYLGAYLDQMLGDVD